MKRLISALLLSLVTFALIQAGPVYGQSYSPQISLLEICGEYD